MTRLASIAKAGFYPTPERVVEWLGNHVLPSNHVLPNQERGRLLDPCSGEGIAAAHLAQVWNLEAYGIEIDAERARASAERLHKVLNLDYAAARIPTHAFQVLYLNPPYSPDESEAKRAEYRFLRDTGKWLQPRGVLIYIIPQYRLDARMARHLATYYREITAYRFPDPEYDDFSQMVVFGIARQDPLFDESVALKLLQQCRGQLPILPETISERYEIPPPLETRFYFRGNQIDPDEALNEALRVGVWHTHEWKQWLEPPQTFDALQPLMPLKKGHLAMLIAAGLLQNLVLEKETATFHRTSLLIKGRTYKVADQVEGDHENEETSRDRFVTEIVAVDLQSGEITRLDEPQALSAFIEQWQDVIAQKVVETFTPLYRFDLVAEGERVNAILNRLSKYRRLPGRAETGLFPAQKHVATALWKRLQRANFAILVGEMGVGKAAPLDARLLTPSGWVRMGDIRVGDRVIGANGKPTTVVGVFPQGEKEIFRVTFTDGSATECCEDHLWQVNTPLRKWRGVSPRVLSLQEIRARLQHANGNLQHFIPLVAPVQFETAAPHSIDPYLLGVFLGDGHLAEYSVRLTTADTEMADRIAPLLPPTVHLKQVSGSPYDYHVTTGHHGRPNPLVQALRTLGLTDKNAPSKFVPKSYLYASVPARIALLQGLLDTDGSVSRGHNTIEYSTASLQLARDVIELVRSLGGTTRMNQRVPHFAYRGARRTGRTNYRIHIALPREVQPFRLSRKAAAYRPREKYLPARAIRKIEPVGRKPAQCIKVDAPDGLYVTDDYIVTHNTTIGSAVSALLQAKGNPTLVLCPPHLVNKWVREIREIVPLAFAMPLYRLSDVEQFVRQVKRMQQDPQAKHTPAFAVLSKEMAKLGSGWQPAYVTRKRAWRLDDDKKQIVTLFECPRCGHIVHHVEANEETAPVINAEYFEKKRRCFACNEALYQSVHLNQTTDDRTQTTEETFFQSPVTEPPLSVAKGRSSSVSASRYPIADYIARRHRGFFKLLITDEVHQLKGQSTDQGYAFGALIRACAKTLALTGTLYGGRATSLFFLLHRLSPNIRHQFQWSDGQKWAERFGILERVAKLSNEENDDYGVFSGKRRRKTFVRELPGISPELVMQLLDSTAFLGLADLGFDMPEYREIPIVLPMASEQRAAYDNLATTLEEELHERIKQGDHSLLGAYLQSLLAYPNACFRAEIVRDRAGEVVASAPALSDAILFPKEEWLVNLACNERAQGRRLIVFCRQTGTRDITARLKTLLQRQGLKSVVLTASVGTQSREEWLRKKLGEGMDVLITNPKLVETGLDLVAFQSTAFYELDYSVYTMQQAARRTWRLGQVDNVKVFYAVYADTMEHRAMGLVAQKLAAALLLTGDVVEGAFLSAAEGQTDSGRGFLADLAKSVINGSQIADLNALFRERARETRAPEFLGVTMQDLRAELAAVVEEEPALLQLIPSANFRQLSLI